MAPASLQLPSPLKGVYVMPKYLPPPPDDADDVADADEVVWDELDVDEDDGAAVVVGGATVLSAEDTAPETPDSAVDATELSDEAGCERPDPTAAAASVTAASMGAKEEIPVGGGPAD